MRTVLVYYLQFSEKTSQLQNDGPRIKINKWQTLTVPTSVCHVHQCVCTEALINTAIFLSSCSLLLFRCLCLSSTHTPIYCVLWLPSLLWVKFFKSIIISCPAHGEHAFTCLGENLKLWSSSDGQRSKGATAHAVDAEYWQAPVNPGCVLMPLTAQSRTWHKPSTKPQTKPQVK